MTQEHYKHPITPPPDLVQELIEDTPLATGAARELHLITVAYQAGADQELEACCEFLQQEGWGPTWVSRLRAARRPKPPSLKQQALETLKYPKDLWSEAEVDTIRRALEQLDD